MPPKENNTIETIENMISIGNSFFTPKYKKNPNIGYNIRNINIVSVNRPFILKYIFFGAF